MSALPMGPDDDVQVEPDTEGLTAHPPGPHIIFHTPKPPTPTEMLRNFAFWLAANIVCLVAAAAIISFAWNALQELHNLQTLNLHQAFAFLVILRVLAFTVRY